MEEKKFTAPYVPFKTFETALNHLAALGGLPAKIDHTIFPSMGGLAKGQVINAFKFLGLVDSDGKPQQSLSELALNRDGRKAAMRKLIKEKYPNIAEADLATMSPGQLDIKLGANGYNAGGATRQKVRAFLLKAAKYSGIPLSSLLTSKGPRGPRKKRASNANAKSPDAEKPKQKGEPKQPSSDSEPMPVALNPGRYVYITLPKDWDGKELKKLLALLKLSLGSGGTR